MKQYNQQQIAWELERTALGDGFYGNALRVAKDIPGMSPEDRSLLDRYANGKNTGTDHVALQQLAMRIHTESRATPSALPAQAVGEKELAALYDAFGIGAAARNLETLRINVENAARRSNCLTAIENTFFTKQLEDEDGPYDDCPLGWGCEPAVYVEQFREALASLAAPMSQAEPEGWQPIETAPKDGTRVLLREQYNDVPIIGYYRDYFGQRFGKWCADQTNYDTDGNACVIDKLVQELISHWQPLPQAPKEQA